MEHRKIDRNDSPGDDGWGRFDGWREGKIDHNSEKNENDSTEKDDQTEPKQVNDFPPTGAVKVEPDFEKEFSMKESLDDYPDYEEEGIEEELPQYSSIEEEIEFEEVQFTIIKIAVNIKINFDMNEVISLVLNKLQIANYLSISRINNPKTFLNDN